MKKGQLLASLAVGTAMVAMAAPVNPQFQMDQEVAFSIEMTAGGTIAWADYNNDGLMDYLLVAGQGTGTHLGLYKQTSVGVFENVTAETGQLDLAYLSAGAAVWFDYNNDGNLDLIVAGREDSSSSSSTMVYVFENEGPAGNYALTENMDLEDVIPMISPDGDGCKGILFAPADFDNDGWTDLIITGTAPGDDMFRHLSYLRNVNGTTFERMSNPEFVGLSGSTIYAADFNQDGLMDFTITGWSDINDNGDAYTTAVYLNKGDNTFEHITGFGMGGHKGSIFPFDINNDGVMDIIEDNSNCKLLNWGHFAHVYMNDGTGKNWTVLKEDATGLEGNAAAVSCGDLNNDGWMDFATSGWGGTTVFIWINNGDNTFTNVVAEEGVFDDKSRARDGDLAMVDYNNDGKLDFAIFGYRDNGGDAIENPSWPNYLHTNVGTYDANQAPSAPVVNNCVQDGNDVVLTWSRSTDDTTPAVALRYNVYAKAKDGSSIYCMSPADLNTGMLRVARTNALLSTTSYRFKNMNINDFEFGVQAVDNGMLGGKFTATSAAVEAVKSENISTFAANGEIKIVNAGEAVNYAVYNANGMQVAAGVAGNGTTTVAPQAGIYVVKVGAAVAKVVL